MHRQWRVLRVCPAVHEHGRLTWACLCAWRHGCLESGHCFLGHSFNNICGVLPGVQRRAARAARARRWRGTLSSIRRPSSCPGSRWRRTPTSITRSPSCPSPPARKVCSPQWRGHLAACPMHAQAASRQQQRLPSDTDVLAQGPCAHYAGVGPVHLTGKQRWLTPDISAVLLPFSLCLCHGKEKQPVLTPVPTSDMHRAPAARGVQAPSFRSYMYTHGIYAYLRPFAG